VASEERDREKVERGATTDVDASELEAVERSIAVALAREADDTPGPELGLEVADGAGFAVAVEFVGAVVVGVGVEVTAGVEFAVPVEAPVDVAVEVGVEVEVVDPEADAGAGAADGAAAAAAPVAGSPPGIPFSGSIDAIAKPSVLPLSAKASVARKGMVRLTQRASSTM
jgi:hypothetical protein